jgi:hypothetical protein
MLTCSIPSSLAFIVSFTVGYETHTIQSSMTFCTNAMRCVSYKASPGVRRQAAISRGVQAPSIRLASCISSQRSGKRTDRSRRHSHDLTDHIIQECGSAILYVFRHLLFGIFYYIDTPSSLFFFLSPSQIWISLPVFTDPVCHGSTNRHAKRDTEACLKVLHRRRLYSAPLGCLFWN